MQRARDTSKKVNGLIQEHILMIRKELGSGGVRSIYDFEVYNDLVVEDLELFFSECKKGE